MTPPTLALLASTSPFSALHAPLEQSTTSCTPRTYCSQPFLSPMESPLWAPTLSSLHVTFRDLSELEVKRIRNSFSYFANSLRIALCLGDSPSFHQQRSHPWRFPILFFKHPCLWHNFLKSFQKNIMTLNLLNFLKNKKVIQTNSNSTQSHMIEVGQTKFTKFDWHP